MMYQISVYDDYSNIKTVKYIAAARLVKPLTEKLYREIVNEAFSVVLVETII